MDVYLMKYSGNPAVCTGLDHNFRPVVGAPLVTPCTKSYIFIFQPITKYIVDDDYYGILLSVEENKSNENIQIQSDILEIGSFCVPKHMRSNGSGQRFIRLSSN